MTSIRHVIIRGRVQAVGFRIWVEDRAIMHDVEGWVRNRRDGTVEAVVQGSAQAVEAMTVWARRGPEQARVQRVDVSPTEGDFPSFGKRPTG